MRVGRGGRPADDLAVAFNAAAGAYDRLVGANPGYHEHLRLSARRMADRMRIQPSGNGLRLLDAGCGTGASTAALLAVAPQSQITAVDASRGMLDEALDKDFPGSVRFVHTPVERLAENGVTGPFDGIFAAYLVRNVADRDEALRRFRNLLVPGGILAVHEYSVRDSAVATQIWNAVCWGIIIPSGWWQTRDATLYRYLWRSVLDFDGAARFRSRLGDAGFSAVHSESVPGWQSGIVHTFLAQAQP